MHVPLPLRRLLSVSGLRRVLTDSTVSRNIGVSLGHTLVARARPGHAHASETALEADLTRHTGAVVAEGVQTILCREQYPAPYEALQAVTRGKPVDEAAMRAFIASLDVSAVRSELGALTPRGVG